MRLFTKVRKSTRFLAAHKFIVSALLFMAVAGVGVVAVSSYQNSKAVAGDCSTNSILKCGAPNRASFINALNSNAQLRAIYAYNYGIPGYGLQPSDYGRFISSARPGVAYASNNTIVVDGRVVATGAWSIGRLKSWQGSNPMTVNIPGAGTSGAGTFYGNYNNKAFASSHTTIPVDVLFDARGNFQFAVMTGSCGNTALGTPNNPNYVCNDLQPVQTGANSWNFTTNATAGNGATITKLVYNFGDGTTQETGNAGTVVSHTFTRDSTVTVSVYVSVPGGGTVVLTNCQRAIHFTPPPAVFACNSLTNTPGKVDENGNQAFSFTANGSATNATIVSYTFNFNDGSPATTVTTAAGSASASHTFAPGSYTTTAVMTVLTNTGATQTTAVSPACSTPITVKQLPTALTCDSLTLIPGDVDATGNQKYTLNAKASVQHGTITSYIFTLGDDSQPVTVTTGDTTASTTHVYAPGNWKASVTVNGKDNTGAEINATSGNCAKTVPVQTPQCKPGVPVGSKECYTYTCDLLSITKGDNRTITISDFKASTSNPKASLKTVNVTWGDSTTDLNNANVVNQQHQYAADGTYTITAVAHFAITGEADDLTATSADCVKTVSYTTATPNVLPNTGAGNVVSIFGAVAVVGTLAHRLFLARRLKQQN